MCSQWHDKKNIRKALDDWSKVVSRELLTMMKGLELAAKQANKSLTPEAIKTAIVSAHDALHTQFGSEFVEFTDAADEVAQVAASRSVANTCMCRGRCHRFASGSTTACCVAIARPTMTQCHFVMSRPTARRGGGRRRWRR